MELVIPDMKRGYMDVIDAILLYGEEAKPRGLSTVEVLNANIILTDPRQSLPTRIGRNLNSRIAAVEALQLLGGVLDPPAMLRASKSFSEYMDGGTFHGGYGQRTRAQVSAAVGRLHEDPNTRRAVITMWDPLHDLFTHGMKDYPCTVSMQFLIRNEKLIMHTHMRSNDVWRGFAYDVFVFTQLQLALAACLSIDVGSYYHHVTSLHMYEEDFDAWETMRGDETKDFEWDPHPALITPNVDNVDRMQEIARACLSGEGEVASDEVNEVVWQWYRERVGHAANVG